MKRLLAFLVALIVLVVVIGLTGDGQSDTDDAATPDSNGGSPTYEVVSTENQVIVVEVDSADQLSDVFAHVTAGLQEQGGYSIRINCSTGASESVDNRLANGRVSIGTMGEVQTGMPDGTVEYSPNANPVCPKVIGTAQTRDRAFGLAAEFEQQGLPARSPRDNTASNCDSLGCAALVTTEDITVVFFTDAAAEQDYLRTFGADAAKAGPFVLSYLAARTPDELRPRYEAVAEAFTR